MDSVNSTTFIKKPPVLTDIEECISYTKKVLTSRLFLGTYEERRYVSAVKDYRDVIIISSEETDLHQDLDKIRKKWLGIRGIKWIGITGPEVVETLKAYCFWVKLTNLPFGSYWFQIKHVKLVEEEILFYLKVIRKTLAPQSVGSSNTFKKQINEVNHERPDKETSDSATLRENPLLFYLSTAYFSCEETFFVIRPYITWKNFFTMMKIICALTIALISTTFTIVHNVGEYFLKLLREVSVLVNAFTPIAIQLIDFASKIIGGFYILLAGIFIGNGPRHPPQLYNNNNFRSIPYSNIVKTPVDWKKRNKILREEFCK